MQLLTPVARLNLFECGAQPITFSWDGSLELQNAIDVVLFSLTNV